MFEKIVQILTVAEHPVLKYHIIRKCNLSSSTFNTYINQLLQSGLLDAYPAVNLKHVSGPRNHHRMLYQTTSKGKEFLKRYNDMLTLLEISVKYPETQSL